MQTDERLTNFPDDGQTDQEEEDRRLPASINMAKSHFVMVPKSFSESVSLRYEGERSRRQYNTTCIYDGGKTFRTAVQFVRQMVPKHFVTVLTVDDEITFYERIEFVCCTKMKDFSESVNVFPREKAVSYCTNFTFDSDYTQRHYIEGIEFFSVQKMNVAADCQLSSALDSMPLDDTETCHINEKKLMNGDVDSPIALLNGCA